MASDLYSPRSLELIFRRGVGMTPGRRFLNVRLNSTARFADTGASELGFGGGYPMGERASLGHLGRFAGQYRQTFGELPSQTLERSRCVL